jgi:hypothetical protein
MDFLKGKRTYIAAAGLLVTAFVQWQAKDVVGAAQSLMAALAAFGLRQALETQPAQPAAPQPPQNPPTTPVI